MRRDEKREKIKKYSSEREKMKRKDIYSSFFLFFFFFFARYGDYASKGLRP